MRRPRIKRTTEQIETPDGDVYLLRPSAGQRHPDRAARRGGTAAARGARRRAHAGGAARAEFGAEEVDDLIAQLQELELVEDAADDDLIAGRRAGALRPPAALLQRHRHRRARRRRSARSGCARRRSRCSGSAGSAAGRRLALACIGVGEMWLIDGDRVEVSNLNRQILYTEADIGLLKVEAAAARLRAFNSAMRVTADGAAAGERGRDRRVHRRLRRRHRRRRLARARHRALVQRRLLRGRHPLHHDEPLPADRPGRAALRARRDRLLRLPGDRLPARVPAVRRRGRAAPGETVARRRRWGPPAA